MIKLATKPDALSKMGWRPLEHDAAVAHALVKAIDGKLPDTCDQIEFASAMRWVKRRAAEILRTDFGIEESP